MTQPFYEEVVGQYWLLGGQLELGRSTNGFGFNPEASIFE